MDVWPACAGPPLIEGDRLYLVSNRAEVICFDIGPLLRSKENETRTPDDDPHVLWKLDMIAELGILPRGPMMGIARLGLAGLVEGVPQDITPELGS